MAKQMTNDEFYRCLGTTAETERMRMNHFFFDGFPEELLTPQEREDVKIVRHARDLQAAANQKAVNEYFESLFKF